MTSPPAPADAPPHAPDRWARCGPGKQDVAFAADGVAFSSRFDSGNLQRVDRAARDEFHVTLAEDAEDSRVFRPTGYTTWFYFEMRVATTERAAAPDALPSSGASGPPRLGSQRKIRLTLTNMNHQRGLYSNGYTVMYAVMTDSPGRRLEDQEAELFFEDERKWKRLPSPVEWERYMTNTSRPVKAPASDSPETDALPVEKVEVELKAETKMRLSFTHHVQSARERVRFAFCYPYPYTKLCRQLESFDRMYASKSRHSDPTGGGDPCTEDDSSASALYYHRQVLAQSLGGLPIELVTISSHDHIVETPSARASKFDLSKKRTVIISARVHPGETPASFMLDGMFRLLLHPTDPSARALRRSFVFKIIPMLNPDGVCQGYYRTDTRGVNLNRVYECPDATQEPAIAATRDLLVDTVNDYLKAGGHKDDVVYLDLHAHSNHRGGFVYGNWLVPNASDIRAPRVLMQQVETQLFAKLCSLNCPYFDYHAITAFNRLSGNANVDTDVRDEALLRFEVAKGMAIESPVAMNADGAMVPANVSLREKWARRPYTYLETVFPAARRLRWVALLVGRPLTDTATGPPTITSLAEKMTVAPVAILAVLAAATLLV
ncbi:hypothetical protein P43SY_000522 [Pythium insidiosum]|uniref:Peptidase M14 domain-containing protein n=1 Tax=Pythium insidiosum TaxID=114742 RepID=A0AAD5QCX9_PYTIN|nr:hypothetical protein P43SY_000522 [Pythium insidiosum]